MRASASGRAGPFPLVASASGRYIQDAFHETPWFINGTTAWSGIVVLDETEIQSYLDNCVTNGFNAVIVNLLQDGSFSEDPPENTFGELPFTGTMFQSTPNEAYFEHADYFFDQALIRGIALLVDPWYIGFDNSQGVGASFAAASQAQVESFASFVGNRYKNQQNILGWSLFGDRKPTGTLLSRCNQARAALAAADTNHLITYHFGPDESTHMGGISGWNLDWIYRYGGFTHDHVEDGWTANGGPVLMCEAWYEDENGATDAQVSNQAWGGWCSGACGVFYGGRDEWAFGYNTIFPGGSWQNYIANTAGVAPVRTQMRYLRALALARPTWHQTVPDLTSTLVTAGRGSGATWVSARFSSTLAIIYIPAGSSSTITVDRTEFSGAFSWHWYNPRTGATSGGATGVSNTGTQQFTPPDGNPWVLVIWVP